MKKRIIIFSILLICGVSYAAYQPQQIIKQGGVNRSLTTDIIQQETLEGILIQLKIMNLYNHIITGTEITETDIE